MATRYDYELKDKLITKYVKVSLSDGYISSYYLKDDENEIVYGPLFWLLYVFWIFSVNAPAPFSM